MLQLIYDDTQTVAPGVGALIGIDRFGGLIFRRRSLGEAMRSAVAAAGLPPILELRSQADWEQIGARIDAGDWPAVSVLLCPSNVVAAESDADLITFLRQAQFSPVNLILPARSAPENGGWTLMSARQFQDYVRKRAIDDVSGFFDQHRHEFSLADSRLALVDLNDQALLLDFLSGAFDVRFFNAISRDEFVITKRSTDKVKLRREYEFFHLLPPSMQMFFVQPFDFEEGPESASYRMERLFVPDVALQWLHGAFQADEFGRFLDRAFYFLSVRPQKDVSAATAAQVFEDLYVTKVKERIDRLKTDPQFGRLEPLIQAGAGSVDRLVDRYLNILQRVRRRFPTNRLVVGHGDFCFSNMLYNKSSQMLKLIDPRGASNQEDLYTDPFYDLAKLSHSILGCYDMINHDMFEVRVAEDMSLDLILDRAPPAWAAAQFTSRLAAARFDPLLVRLCEASLFISMLPLHMDRPRKVLGFAVNAARILDEIDAAL